MTGKIKAIYLRRNKDETPISVNSASVQPGLGLEGDHFKKKNGLRQVTLLSQQAWNEVCKDLGTKLEPSLRRANILLDGIDLKESKGKILKIGQVTIQVEGETTPCRLMDEAFPGLKDVLTNWRGGAYGRILKGGIIRVGEKVFWSSGL